MTEILLTMLLMGLCLLAEGFFSGSEMGIVSADQIKLRHAAAKGSKGAKLALSMLERPEWLLSTTLVGTNIAVVTNTTLATALMMQLFGPNASWLAVVLVAPLIWVFGEIVPKSVFQQRADTITPRTVFVLRFFSYLFYPILLVFSFLARTLARLLGDKPDRDNPFTLREQILTMMQMSADEGDIEASERIMIRRLFDFGETTAREVMVPLIDVVTIDNTLTVGEAVRVARDQAHVRLPVHADRVDEIVGVLDTMTLLGLDPMLPIKPHVAPVDYVPGSRSIQDLLQDLHREKQRMAVVVDEFGGAEGIVTTEDIMEEVVDEMEDEYDPDTNPTQWIRKLGDRDYLVSARIELDSLVEKLGVELPEGNYTSLAGFLLEKAQDVPPVGTVVEYQGVIFTVTKATPKAIQEVRVRYETTSSNHGPARN